MISAILKVELKHFVRSKGFWILAAFLGLLLAIISVVFASFSEDNPPHDVYGVENYSSRDELARRMEDTSELIAQTEEWLALSEGDLSISESTRQEQARWLSEQKRTLQVLTLLWENNISYEEIGEYIGSFQAVPRASNATSVLALSLIVGCSMICLFSAAKITIKVPAEFQEGQVRLTTLLPRGRTYYFVTRWLSILLTGLITMIGYTLAAALIMLCVFGAKGYLIVAAPTYAAALNFGTTVLSLFFVYLFLLVSFSAFAFALSLLIRRVLPSFTAAAIVFLCGKIAVPIELLTGEIKISNYLFPCAFFADNSFLGVSANPIWANLLILVGICLGLGAISLFCLKHRDIS